MNVVKTLWASVQGDPVFMRRVNGWLAIFWVGNDPCQLCLGLAEERRVVSALSLCAPVSGHWSAWQAARVEVSQEEQIAEQSANPIEKKVVKAIIDETEIDEAPPRQPD